jgi:hypothetical protein
VLLASCPCADVLATVGAVVLAGFPPFAMSLYDALAHGARSLVLYWSYWVSMSAGISFALNAER